MNDKQCLLQVFPLKQPFITSKVLFLCLKLDQKPKTFDKLAIKNLTKILLPKVELSQIM